MKLNRQISWERILVVVFCVVFLWSGYAPQDRFTWYLEVFPAAIGFVILAATYRRFQFTLLTYGLICLHAVILLIGG